MLGKNTSIPSINRLLQLAGFREKIEEGVKKTCFMTKATSVPPNKSFTVFFAR